MTGRELQLKPTRLCKLTLETISAKALGNYFGVQRQEA